MRLYLVQHGDALPKDVDPERALSERGRSDVQRVAAALAGRVRVARVAHSGKTRARQTAELLTAALAPGLPIEVMPGIDPLDPTEPAARDLQGRQEDTLVVGHMPFMGKLATRLLTGSETPGIVDYQPGSIVCLAREADDRWLLVWMLRPELWAG